MDFKIDISPGGTWDLVIEAGELATVDGIDEMRQRIGIAMRTHQGEWLYDIDRGVPYIQEILVKSPDLGAIQSRLHAYILSIEGVTAVRSLVITPPTVARELAISIDAETTEGLTGPFNVTIPGI